MAGFRLLLVGAALVSVAGCGTVDGTAVYQSQEPAEPSTTVKDTDLESLLLPLSDIGAVIGSPDLTRVENPPVSTLPPGTLSDETCAAIIRPGLQLTYRTSGFLAAAGVTAEDQHENNVAETVAVYPSAAYARAFVGSTVAQWKTCIEKSVTVTFGGYTSVWMGFGPGKADGVDVLLVRREGGRGYACGRAIDARANVTVDAMVCGRDEAVVNQQAARYVTDSLAKIKA